MTADKAQTSTSQTTEAGNTSDKADATADKTTGAGETGNAGNATAGDANNGNTAADGTNQNDAAANGVATVTSADGTTTSYPTFAAALAAAKAGETVTLTKNSDESTVRVDKKITVTAANGAVYSGTMSVTDGATITGMTFELTGKGGSTTSVALHGAGAVTISGNTFTFAKDVDATQNYNGIQLDNGSSNVTISGNHFEFPRSANNKSRKGINLQGGGTAPNNYVRNVSITGNTVNATGDGQGTVEFLVADGNIANGVDGVTVTGNTVKADANAKSGTYGVLVLGVKDLTLTGNTFDSVKQVLGVDGTATSGVINGATLGGNTFKSTGLGYAIQPQQATGTWRVLPEQSGTASSYIQAVVNHADGTSTIYATGDDAFAAANAGETVLLTSHVQLTKPVTIDKKLTIIGQGYMLHGQLQFVKGAGGSKVSGTTFYTDSRLATAEGSANILIQTGDVTVSGNRFVTPDDSLKDKNPANVLIQAKDGKTITGVTVSGNTFQSADSKSAGTTGVRLAEDSKSTISDVTVSDNTFGVHTGVSLDADGKHAEQKDPIVKVTGNKFTGKTAVADNGGVSPDKIDYGTGSGNDIADGTDPYVGTDKNGVDSYGVTYVDYSNKQRLSWEIVAKDGTVKSIPAKSGYTTNLYVSDGSSTGFKLFDPSTKVTDNLTLYVTFTSTGGNGGNGGTVVYPSSPEVTTKPNKLEYRIGEQFDATGMVVRYRGSALTPDQYTVTLDTSKPGKVKVFITLNSDPTKATSFEVTVVISDVQVHRLYNPRSGEHFYVSSENEYNVLIKSGQWRDEGIGFTMVDYGTPVYRLYNPGGKHLFTTSVKERDVLIGAKWNYEGVAFYVPESSDGSGDSAVKVHRLYNPGNGDHLLTTSANERGVLVMHGWRDEGTAFTAR